MCRQSTEDLRDLYRNLILDHAREPRHFGKLDQPTHEARGVNRLCGDKLRIYLRVEDGAVSDVSFAGVGCAITIASASLLTQVLKGMSTQDALAFSDRLMQRLTAGQNDDSNFDPGALRALEGVREYPARVKCATLPWQTLKSAIEGNEATASTE